MSTLTLRPIGIVHSSLSGTWTDVDEDPANDLDFVSSDTSGNDQYDIYHFQPVPSDLNSFTAKIRNVAIYGRLKKTGMNAGWSDFGFHVGTRFYWSAGRRPSGLWKLYSDTWTTNPATGVAWTWTDITNLQAGVLLQGAGDPELVSEAYVMCSQLYVVIDYEPLKYLGPSAKLSQHTGLNGSINIRPFSLPPLTPSVPTGPTIGNLLTIYTFFTSTTDPDNDHIKYVLNWGDGTETTSNWTVSGETAIVSHAWGAPGTYLVTVQAVDTNTHESGWSAPHTIVINVPPNKPSAPTGSVLGNPSIEYSYTTTAIDPTGQLLKYKFDWGDGTNTDSGWYSSNVPVTLTHSYVATGAYLVKAMVTNYLGAVSDYGTELSVEIYSIPNTPIAPTGSVLGNPNTNYTFSATTIDPDSHSIQYTFVWGDGTPNTVTNWTPSGTMVTKSHAFDAFGMYHVTVFASNDYFNSAVSAPLTIKIVGTKTYCRIVGI